MNFPGKPADTFAVYILEDAWAGMQQVKQRPQDFVRILDTMTKQREHWPCLRIYVFLRRSDQQFNIRRVDDTVPAEFLMDGYAADKHGIL